MQNFIIEGNLQFSQLSNLREKMLTSINPRQALILDFVSMEKLDVSGVQLVLSIQAWLHKNKAELFLRSGPESDRINRLAQKLGMPGFGTQEAGK